MTAVLLIQYRDVRLVYTSRMYSILIIFTNNYTIDMTAVLLIHYRDVRLVYICTVFLYYYIH